MRSRAEGRFKMSQGLYDGFEHYRVLTSRQIGEALQSGMLVVDTNVLLNLYRYNEKTVDDLVNVVSAANDRLFVPHQVVREFWRNRQSVIAGLGSAAKDANLALSKNSTSTRDAVSRWAKSVAIADGERDGLLEKIEILFQSLKNRVGDAPARVLTHTPTERDPLLARLEQIFAGRVGDQLSDEEWAAAVAEGERRVDGSIPPGYMDAEKLESDLPEGASGDFLVWHEVLRAGSTRQVDCVLVTADTKEDWWNRGERGAPIGPRPELVKEYFSETGHRFFILEPADLVKHSAALGVGTSPESVQDIERVRDEPVDYSEWSAEDVTLVLRELERRGHIQAAVIREAINSGGRISRARVYELDGRDETSMLRGFTRPVSRITAELQDNAELPMDIPPLLDAVYETGVKSSHFAVPRGVVDLFPEGM